MKLFVDSANLVEIEEALERGFVSGITTNPSILSKEEKGDYHAHIGKLINLVARHGPLLPLSVEVFTADPIEMHAQADELTKQFRAYPGLYIKIPIGWAELVIIRQLREEGVQVNCTCCMSVNQVLLAAAAGASIVSLFYGRIKDTGQDASAVVRAAAEILKVGDVDVELLVGSIRHPSDVMEAFLAGADIVTVPPPILRQMVVHPKTDEAVKQFLADFERWQR